MLAVHGVEALLDRHDAVVGVADRVLVDVVVDAPFRRNDERLELFELVFLALQPLVEVADDLLIVLQRFFRDDAAVDFAADAHDAAVQRLDVEAHFLDLAQRERELAFFKLLAQDELVDRQLVFVEVFLRREHELEALLVEHVVLRIRRDVGLVGFEIRKLCRALLLRRPVEERLGVAAAGRRAEHLYDVARELLVIGKAVRQPAVCLALQKARELADARVLAAIEHAVEKEQERHEPELHRRRLRAVFPAELASAQAVERREEQDAAHALRKIFKCHL